MISDKEGSMKKSIIFFVWIVAAVSFSAASVGGTDLKKEKCDPTLQGKATEDIYVDLATMHRYIKNPDGTYCEYDRKGKLLKTVSSELPLLTGRPHVTPLTSHCYLLYVKKQKSGPDHPVTVKPAKDPHPEGWFLEKALVDLKYTRH